MSFLTARNKNIFSDIYSPKGTQDQYFSVAEFLSIPEDANIKKFV